jgi:hypothetical protein
MISDFYFKKLGKMIDSDRGEGSYELNEKFSPKLLDLGYIKLNRWSEILGKYTCLCSSFVVTELGKKSYDEWKNK